MRLFSLKRSIRRHWPTLVLLVILFLLIFMQWHPPSISTNQDLSQQANNIISRCKRPDFELMPKEFIKFFKLAKPIVCKNEQNLVETRGGKLKIKSNKKGIKCRATPIKWQTDYEVSIREIEKRDEFTNNDEAPSDFMTVECKDKQRLVYSGIHSTVVKKKMILQPNKKKTSLNVFILGFDSISRLSWLRLMPRTHKFFTNVLGGLVMEGYNIVGDGTPQALLPMLTGKQEFELYESRKSMKDAKPLDDYPWIWNEFKKRGYVTQWAEDGAEYGTFQYRMLGFKKPPVDHYMRTFYLHAEAQYHKHHPFCLGSLMRHKNMLNWPQDLFEVYTNSTPKFSFIFHSELSHDSLSNLQFVDNDVMVLLEWMKTKKHLDNTVLILMSDHGPRYSELRETMQGKYEERLPYLGIYIPRMIHDRFPQIKDNLKHNQNVLTTPFDVHETLKDILNIDKYENEKKVKSNPGMSLLRHIPEERTCDTAGVDSHWCTCLNWISVNINDDSVKASVFALLKHINELTKNHREHCLELTLGFTKHAEMLTPNIDLLHFKQSKDEDGRIVDFTGKTNVTQIFFQVTIETTPNQGVYEATIKHDLLKKEFTVDTSQISRLNKYGNQPECIMEDYPILRPFCFCK